MTQLNCQQSFMYENNDLEWDLITTTNYENGEFDDLGLLEETSDATIKYQPEFQLTFPEVALGPPDRRDFSGDYNFTVEIDAKETNRRKYLYSYKLNCIYVDNKVNFPVHFNWQSTTSSHMYVRATTVFSDKAQAEKRVETCLQHKHESGVNKASVLSHHVLHSNREPDAFGVLYCGDPDRTDSWFSVLVRFNNDGQQKTHAYYFICKNSCSSGINRRSTAIIFTLEDETGMVYGRQSVGVRVCSCARRDLKHDEEDAQSDPQSHIKGKKRVIKILEPSNKKIKVEDTRDEVITLPQLQVVGAEAVIAGLHVTAAMMKQKLSMINDQSTRDMYTNSINDVTNYIKTLETEP